jgi:hypothetical protein
MMPREAIQGGASVRTGRRNSGHWVRRLALAALLSLLAAAASAAASAAEDKSPAKPQDRGNPGPALMKLSAGLFGDIVADRQSAGLFSFEYRAGPGLEVLWVRPSLGTLVTMDGAGYGWLGLNVDLPLGPLVLTASTTFGIYGEGDGQDLGSLFVARNGAEIAWQFANRSRLGVAFHYYSNYETGNENPGAGAVTLVYSHPLRAVIR